MHSLTGGFEVLPGIKVIRMLGEVLADNRGHCQTDIGVNVDFANCTAGCLTELFFRNADGTGHVAAVLVDDLHEFLRNRGRTMQYDRESGQLLGTFFEHIEPELGFGAGFELVGAVAGADGDSQGVTAGAGREFNHFFRMRVHCLVGIDGNLIFHAGESTEFSFDHDTMIMCVLNDLTGEGDILFERLGGSVDHDRGETAVDAALAQFKGVTMIQVQRDRDLGVQLYSSLYELDQVGMVGIGTGTLGYLQDDGSLKLSGGIGNTLNDFHVVDVEGADSVSAVIGFLKHFSCCNQWHGTDLL